MRISDSIARLLTERRGFVWVAVIALTAACLAVLITRMAEGDPWPRRWDLSSERTADIRQAVDSLCTWGLWSPDLNATNVMLPSTGGALFLDWDRARFEPPDVDLWPRYRARLERSLRKLGAPAEAFEIIGSSSHP